MTAGEAPLLACPLCSTPPAVLSRPTCVRGARMGRFFLVPAAHCQHIDTLRADNDADGPEPLVEWWNTWAAKAAATRCAARGMSDEAAARWFDALRPHQYAPTLVRR